MEEHFLGDPFNTDKEGAGVSDVSLLIEESIGISGAEGFF